MCMCVRARACVCTRALPACLFRSTGKRSTVDHLEGGCSAVLPGAPSLGAPFSRAPAPIYSPNHCNAATFPNLLEGEAEYREAERRGEGAEIKVVSFFGSRFCFC